MILGKIVEVPLRDVWPNEATSFTPWLEANPQELGVVLGLDLEFAREKPIGRFSLDLFGSDLTTGRRVIVENQLETSDHSHLGQLITYAGGSEPAIIVWIAKTIRQEHRAALEWLNSVTDSETLFFGIEVKAIKISDSVPAPMLDIVVEPNSWTKAMRTGNNGQFETDKAKTYATFWRRFIDEMSDKYPELNSRTAWARNWLPTSVGLSGVNVNLVFTSEGLRVETYFGSSEPDVNTRRFEAVLALRSQLETHIGKTADWEPLEGKKASRISLKGPSGGIEEMDRWDEYSAWFSNAYQLMRDVTTSKIVPAIRGL